MRQFTLRLPDWLADLMEQHIPDPHATGARNKFMVAVIEKGMMCHIEDLREEAKPDNG